jgi:hypothetical protein
MASCGFRVPSRADLGAQEDTVLNGHRSITLMSCLCYVLGPAQTFSKMETDSSTSWVSRF